MKEVYEVKVDRPDGVGVKEMASYILSAVSCWRGQYHPDEPIRQKKRIVISIKRKVGDA